MKGLYRPLLTLPEDPYWTPFRLPPPRDEVHIQKKV